jgi:hypothetical protein
MKLGHCRIKVRSGCYNSEEAEDGLPSGEGVFLPCSFWLAELSTGFLSHSFAEYGVYFLARNLVSARRRSVPSMNE